MFDVGRGPNDPGGQGISFLINKIIVYTDDPTADNKYDDLFPSNPFLPDSKVHCAQEPATLKSDSSCHGSRPCAQSYLNVLSDSGGYGTPPGWVGLTFSRQT